MKIRFTKEVFRSKQETITALGSVSWLEIEGDFNFLIELYRRGHVIHISDTVTTEALILDLDSLTQEQADLIHSEAYMAWLTANTGATRIVRFDSSSRKYCKQKLIVGKHTPRVLVRNKDQAYVAFRKEFEALTGMKCDSKMDAYTQVTFGVRESGLPKLDFSAATPSSQPKRCRPAEPQEISSQGRFIPLDAHGYNKRYGKKPRSCGRFEWLTDHYVGPRTTKRTMISAGKRHNTIGKLIKCVVYNLMNQNKNFGADFVENDAATTIVSVVRRQFEGSAKFLNEELPAIRAQLHKELTAATSMGLDAYYTWASKEAKNKERYKYTPRTSTLKALLLSHSAFFTTCKDPQAVADRIGFLAQGDAKAMAQLKRYYRTLIANPTSSRENRTVASTERYNAYIQSCETVNGRLRVDAKHYRNQHFRLFCKRQGIALSLAAV